MRIEAYNQIASIYKTSKTGKVQQPYGVSTGRDEVQISRLGRRLPDRKTGSRRSFGYQGR